MALGGSTCHSGLYGPGSGIALRQQHDHRWQPRSWASVWTLLATWDTDSGCGRTMVTDMVFGNSLDVIVAIVGTADHLDRHGFTECSLNVSISPSGISDLGHLLGLLC